jgi:polyisoprenoid-binding protein YceI
MIRRIALAPSPALAAALALAASFVFTSTPLRAASYTLEPDYTQGVFRWNHLGFSSPAAQFDQGTGTLEFDPSDPSKSSVQVTIPLASLNTGVPALDEDFRSTDFFDTAKFPTATFQSTKVVKGAAADHLEVTGDLSLHGVTRPVMLEVTVVKIGTNPRTNVPTVGFDATTILKRSDFGLGKYVPQVGDEIQMHIIVQAVDAAANAEYLKALAARRAAKAKEAAKDAAKDAAKK